MFDLFNQGPKGVAKAKNVIAATQHPDVTKAMLDVIRDGGNAIDASIMACMLQNVYEPHMSNHAGSIDFLYYEADTGKVHFLNGVAEFPEGLKPLTPNPHDQRSCTIPGFAPSLAALHKRFGTKEWSYYCQPAIKAAKKGTVMTSFEYACLDGLTDRNTYFPSGREFYYPNGFLVPVGYKWKKPNLAITLKKLSEEGPDYFITGSWAEHFVEMSNEIGWNININHLKTYEPRWIEPIKFAYNNNEMYGSPPPDTGGLMMAYILGVLEEFDLKSLGHYSDSAETLYIIAWMLKRARIELLEVIQDTLNYKVPTKIFLSKDYQRFVSEILKESMPIIDLTKDLQLNSSKSALIAGGLGNRNEGVDSCHNVIRDSEGNWVTMMHTQNGGGIPGLVVDGVSMGGGSGNAKCVGNGRRIRLPICPILVMNKNNEPWMALGTPGNPVYSTPIVLSNIFEFNMSPNEAIDAPRFWSMQGDFNLQKGARYSIDIEHRISKTTITGLARLGVQVNPLGTYRWNMGSFQIIWKDMKTGMLNGTSDPRRLGYAEGY